MQVAIKGQYFYCLFLINFLITFSFGINDSLFSLYYSGFEVSGALLGMAFTLYYFSKTALSPLSGRLIDKLGTKKVLFYALFLYSVLSLMYLCIHDKYIILILRIFQGFACALFRPVMYCIIGNNVHCSVRGRSMGFFDISFYSALAVSPIIGGIIKDISDYDTIFILMLVCCLMALLLTFFCLPVLRPAGVGEPGKSPGISHKYNLLFSGLLVYIFFRGWGISCAAIVIPLYLDGMTFSKTGIGIILSLSATTMALSLPFTGRLADITRKETLIFIGGAAASLCLMLIPRLSGLFPLMAAVTAGGFFSALSQPSCSSLLVEIADNGSIGLIMGRFNFIMGLGAAVGAVTSSALFASFGVALTLSVAGVMNIAASFIFAAMTERSFSLSSS